MNFGGRSMTAPTMTGNVGDVMRLPLSQKSKIFASSPDKGSRGRMEVGAKKVRIAFAIRAFLIR